MTFKSSSFARLGLGLFAVLCLSLPHAASAQSTSVTTGKGDIMPAASTSPETAKEYAVAPGEETHPPIRLSPDKTEMVRLDEDAESIIIGNPAHVNILLNNPRLLMLTARQPGATQITILNGTGKIIMQRHVIVSGPQDKYVRIRRSCINGGGNCAPTTVYYCPGICHDVQLLGGQGDSAGNSEAIPGSNEEQQSSAEPPAEDEDLPGEVPLITSDEESAADSDDDGDTGSSGTTDGAPRAQ